MSPAPLFLRAILVTAVLAGIPSPARSAAPPAATPGETGADRLSRIEQAMWNQDKEAVPYLREWADGDDNERIRERSIGALILLGDRGAAPILFRRLAGDPSPRVRRAAAEAIGVLKVPSSGVVLSEPLQKDPDALVRAECARAIGRTGRRQIFPVLIRTLVEDKSPEVRALCAEALALLEVREAADLLRSIAASDPSPLVRIHILRALGVVAPAESVPLFRDVWESANDPELRLEAFRQLLASTRSGEWERTGLAAPDDRVRFLSVRQWLSRLPAPSPSSRLPRRSDVVLRLESFLSDKVRGIRELAKESLEKHGFTVKESGFLYVVAE